MNLTEDERELTEDEEDAREYERICLDAWSGYISDAVGEPVAHILCEDQLGERIVSEQALECPLT
jgi:hypothetical protein